MMKEIGVEMKTRDDVLREAVEIARKKYIEEFGLSQEATWSTVDPLICEKALFPS